VDTALGELSPATCWDLLRSADIGRLAVVVHGQPFIFPVNYAVQDGYLVFHTDEGAKLDGALRTQSVAFEVDWTDPEGGMAWSVVVAGSAAAVVDPDRVSSLVAALPPSWDFDDRPYLIEIEPHELTGRVYSYSPGMI
jgi:nitroimidazol reductase NimA-like FMN-containing flavoprotein (pyridoxamine 5'-phosphate oxidase superfamily)